MTALLDAVGIRALIPHAGRMSLLDTLDAWDATAIRCTATGHTAPDHPLRSAGALLAPAADAPVRAREAEETADEDDAFDG